MSTVVVVYIVYQMWYSPSMNPKTLYNYFNHAIKCNDNTEIDELRQLVKETIGVYHKMPDKTLLGTFRRKLFSENLEVPPDKKEKMDKLNEMYGDLVDIFEEVEDLFKI